MLEQLAYAWGFIIFGPSLIWASFVANTPKSRRELTGVRNAVHRTIRWIATGKHDPSAFGEDHL